jgi:hypothetical protein
VRTVLVKNGCAKCSIEGRVIPQDRADWRDRAANPD